MNFGEALKALQEGKFVQRKGWNGKNMHLYYVEKETTTNKDGDTVTTEPSIWMKNAQGTYSVWMPSVMDLFANDWEIIQIAG